MTSFRRREAFMGYLFLTPWLLGFLIFLAGPMVASLYFSFTEYKVIKAPLWIGLANYQRMLGDDRAIRAGQAGDALGAAQFDSGDARFNHVCKVLRKKAAVEAACWRA